MTLPREAAYTPNVPLRKNTPLPLPRPALRLPLALLFPLALAACGGDGAKAGGPTPEAIKAANGLVKPFDPWPAAEQKLVAKLGKATRVDGTKNWWAAMAGDDCVGMYVENNKGQVGTVMHPDKFFKKDNNMYFKQCIAAVAK